MPEITGPRRVHLETGEVDIWIARSNMAEITTEAGKRFLASLDTTWEPWQTTLDQYRDEIAAIEAEARKQMLDELLVDRGLLYSMYAQGLGGWWRAEMALRIAALDAILDTKKGRGDG